MFSPGKWHEKVPRDLAGNLRFRIGLLKAAERDLSLQAGLREMYRKDILFWINSMVWQTNPKKKGGGEVGPFITWPFQERALLSEEKGREGILWCIEHDEDFVVEKSREMGATWLFLIVMDWLDRFQPFHDSLMMSKSALAVDSPSRQSLFGKLRFLHSKLPTWLHDDSQFVDNKNFFGYPGTKSTATGLASTGKAGVSERSGEMFFDEFSQVEDDWEVYHRTNSTTGCRMFNGTHMGLGTAFYALTQDKWIKKIQFHWVQHPGKNKGLYRWNQQTFKIEYLRYDPQTDEVVPAPCDYPFPPDYEYNKTGNPVGGPYPQVRSPWYDKEFRRVGENLAEMAKDQDINPEGSVSQFYHPLVIRKLKELTCAPFWEGELKYDRDSARALEFMEEKDGKIKLWCHLRDGMPPISTYGCGVDVSQGTGATPSCLSIVDGKTGEKVLEYQDANIDPKEFGIFAVALCKVFADIDGNGAKMGWENHGPGTAFGKMVWETLSYRNIFYAINETSIKKTMSDTPGWRPQGVGRINLHSEYRLALFERRYLNRSAQALEETLAFKHTANGSVEHSMFSTKKGDVTGRENHGDIVIADALSCKMVIGDKMGRAIELAKRDEQPLNELSLAGRRRMRELQESW